MTTDLSKITVIRTSSQCIEDKFEALDDAGVANLVAMALSGDMTNPLKIDIAVRIATERGLIEVG